MQALVSPLARVLSLHLPLPWSPPATPPTPDLIAHGVAQRAASGRARYRLVSEHSRHLAEVPVNERAVVASLELAVCDRLVGLSKGDYA